MVRTSSGERGLAWEGSTGRSVAAMPGARLVLGARRGSPAWVRRGPGAVSGGLGGVPAWVGRRAGAGPPGACPGSGGSCLGSGGGGVAGKAAGRNGGGVASADRKSVV